MGYLARLSEILFTEENLVIILCIEMIIIGIMHFPKTKQKQKNYLHGLVFCGILAMGIQLMFMDSDMAQWWSSDPTLMNFMGTFVPICFMVGVAAMVVSDAGPKKKKKKVKRKDQRWYNA